MRNAGITEIQKAETAEEIQRRRGDAEEIPMSDKNLYSSEEIISLVNDPDQSVYENALATKVISASIEVHKTLGPGLLESVYKECLFYKIQKSGLQVVKEKPMPLVFEEVTFEYGYRVDLLVENKLIIEIKSVDAINDVHLAQTLTYLKLGNYKLGLLINFNVALLKSGIRRVVNNI